MAELDRLRTELCVLTAEEAIPGTRVTWADPHPDGPPDEVGVVQRPTLLDRLRHRVWYRYPRNRNVLVEWGGEEWDSAWHDPSELRQVPEAHR